MLVFHGVIVYSNRREFMVCALFMMVESIQRAFLFYSESLYL